MVIPTLKQVIVAGAFVGAGLGGYITARVAKVDAAIEVPLSEKRLVAIEKKLETMGDQLTEIKSDVRFLKCSAGFPGDCPGRSK